MTTDDRETVEQLRVGGWVPTPRYARPSDAHPVAQIDPLAERGAGAGAGTAATAGAGAAAGAGAHRPVADDPSRPAALIPEHALTPTTLIPAGLTRGGPRSARGAHRRHGSWTSTALAALPSQRTMITAAGVTLIVASAGAVALDAATRQDRGGISRVIGTPGPTASPEDPTGRGTAAVPVPQTAWSKAASNSHEAEDPANTQISGTNISELPAAAGGRLVTDLGNGAAVRFNGVSVATTGPYRLMVYYAGTESRTMTIRVNSGPAEAFTFPAADAAGAIAVHTVVVTLTAGANVLEFGNIAGRAPDLDRIVIVDSGYTATPQLNLDPSPESVNAARPDGAAPADIFTTRTFAAAPVAANSASPRAPRVDVPRVVHPSGGQPTGYDQPAGSGTRNQRPVPGGPRTPSGPPASSPDGPGPDRSGPDRPVPAQPSGPTSPGRPPGQPPTQPDRRATQPDRRATQPDRPAAGPDRPTAGPDRRAAGPDRRTTGSNRPPAQRDRRATGLDRAAAQPARPLAHRTSRAPGESAGLPEARSADRYHGGSRHPDPRHAARDSVAGQASPAARGSANGGEAHGSATERRGSAARAGGARQPADQSGTADSRPSAGKPTGTNDGAGRPSGGMARQPSATFGAPRSTR